MSIFLHPGNPNLRMPVPEVPKDDILSAEVQSVIDTMLAIAKGERDGRERDPLVGLAAPQIGVYKQIVLVDIGSNTERNLGELKAYINPKIVWRSDEYETGYESCCSVDERIFGIVPRALTIKITAFDREGNFLEQEFSGFTARIFQHEVDHLIGVRFPDLVANANGCLHWVEEHQYTQYKDTWQQWPVHISHEVWHAMKSDEPYQTPQ